MALRCHLAQNNKNKKQKPQKTVRLFAELSDRVFANRDTIVLKKKSKSIYSMKYQEENRGYDYL